MYGLLEGTNHHRMTTLKKAHTAWKRRVKGFEKALYQIEAAVTNSAITDVEYEEQQLKEVNLLWDKLEETYAEFEDEYPEPEEPVLEQSDEA